MVKDPQIIHNTEPLQTETPLEALREARITPTQALYVRHNQGLPSMTTLEPPARPDWTLELITTESHVFSLAELQAFPQEELELVLQCSGNSRSRFGAFAPVAGSPWEHGAMGNVRFGGVPLRALVPELPPEARYLTATSETHPDGSTPFERSVPLAEVYETAFVALTLNGEPLPAVHGGPLRLVLPGFYGVNNVKWLRRLVLSDSESCSLYQQTRYRLPLTPLEPGQPFLPTAENSRSSYLQRLKSVVFAPLESKCVTGDLTVRGVAWNSGRVLLAAVELSFDEGRSWQEAGLEPAASPYSWWHWSLGVTLEPGRYNLWVRARDRAGEVQPSSDALRWNPDGYEYAALERVTFEAL